MNKLKRRRLKRKTNFKLLLFTFLGAFITFFLAFTYFLPVVTPEVEIPALTEEHTINSITSQDFRGRVDPRLKSLEMQEKIGPVLYKGKDKKEDEKAESDKNIAVAQNEPVGSISNEEDWFYEINNKKPEDLNKEQSEENLNKKEISEKPAKKETTQNSIIIKPKNAPPVPRPAAPPVPKRPSLKQKLTLEAPKPIFLARVVVGNYSNPMDARTVSDSLIEKHFSPFIREKNGTYMLQVGSFSDVKKAEELLGRLKENNFEARIIYE